MNFYSTRDTERSAGFSLRDAAMMGLAPDGGLFVPEAVPQADMAEVERLAEESYAAMATYLAGLFFGDDFDMKALGQELQKIYTFPVPLQKVGNGRYTLELFHGPTCAFKDFGAGFMGRAMGLLGAGKERLVILTATSGDTGSAVAHGFYNVPGIDVVVLYPEGKISPLQECQMTSLGGNIHPLRVAGTFDDCQKLVKDLFSDADFRRKRKVTSANSINLLRWIPQAFYYFYGYCQWKKTVSAGSAQTAFSQTCSAQNATSSQASGAQDGPVIVVPSGNYGNLAAGMLARRMGLPVKGFVAASNRNDVVPEFIRTGVYTPRPSVRTPANAMDVGAPSNFERMIWLYDGDSEALRQDLKGFSLDDDGIRSTIGELYDNYGYFSDPHSAIGYAASEAVDSPGFYLSTAHPAKFGEVISGVTGVEVPLPQRLQKLLDREKHCDPLSVSLPDLEAFVEAV